MDRRFRGDAWVEDRHDGTLLLYIGNYCLAAVSAPPLDLPHLNHLLDRLRQGPRGRGEGAHPRNSLPSSTQPLPASPFGGLLLGNAPGAAQGEEE
jgi:hypothetical protein